jgi:tRNA(Ile)-lysidine synthase
VSGVRIPAPLQNYLSYYNPSPSLSSMIEKVKNFILANQLITANTQHVFAAVSGGIDSCVLLHMLNQLREEIGYRLLVVHFNHHTRGKSSNDDQRFVEELAGTYGNQIKIGNLPASLTKMTETTLREERYRFFTKILTQQPKAVIATGHNRDDNIETFIMRLAKGSRLRGLLGIRPRRNGFIRPLLPFSRKQIEDYARENKLDFREDISNRDQSILRNRLRHTVIPLLKNHLDDRLEENLIKVIYDLSLYYQLFENRLQEAIIASVKKSAAGISLNRKRYQNFNEAVRRGLIEYCISKLYPVNYKISDRNFIVWDTFIRDGKPGKKRSFLNEGIAIAERKQILFGDLVRNRDDIYPLSLGKPLSLNEEFTILFNEVKAAEVSFSNNRNIELIDGEQSGKRLNVRFWQTGDRFKPLGMKHQRKLSDFFIDLKLNTARKKEIPIVCNRKQIIWIAGFRLDEDLKVTPKTKVYYKLELRKN